MEERFKTKKLREGFTTGSSATAAIIACLYALFNGTTPSFVNIKAPAGILTIPIESYLLFSNYAKAVVKKDGGDDPDCTHNIKIVSELFLYERPSNRRELHPLKISPFFEFFSGEGIGIVTKRGLPIEIGEPAINPIPRKMIKENIESFLEKMHINVKPLIILSVPEGVIVAKKTLNERLGIVNGISILGTTGVVKPVSMSAYTATIDIALNIAKEKSKEKVVLSFGRQSEESAMKLLNLPEESFIVMGDHFDYALNRAKNLGFKKIIISCQLGKLLKALLGYKNTNVKYGEFDINEVVDFFKQLKVDEKEMEKIKLANSARHLLEVIESFKINYLLNIITKEFSKKFGVEVLLFSYDGRLLART